jgi:hypothetical protein
LWLVKFHPELTDGQISKLVGTTKPTISAIRERSHWNIQNIQPIDPVALGLCKQLELDAAVQKANAKKTLEGEPSSDDKSRKLVSTSQSLEVGMDETEKPETVANPEVSTVTEESNQDTEEPIMDAESLFKTSNSDETD